MLVGRGGLLAEIQRQLSARGQVRLTGPTGIGRSAILEAVAADWAARGRSVWRITPTQGDRQIVHIGLSDLLNGLDVSGLPEPQAAAIAIVLRQAEGTPDPTALRLGVLAVLKRAASPLIIVDDAEWLDEASAEVLTFAMRRVGREISLLTARRRAEALTLDRDAVEIPVPALESAHMVELLGAHGLTCRHASRVHSASGGNPRLALAIGAAPAESRLPQHVTLICREQLMEVPAAVRRLVLFAALAGRVSLSGLRWAGLPLAAEQAAHAEHAGLLTVDIDDHVTVQSGALGATAIADATAVELRKCHETLADAAEDETTRLWHTAMAVTGTPEGGSAARATTDSSLAEPLAAARLEARAQGQPRRAAELALRAAELASPNMDRAMVIGWLADAAQDASAVGGTELVRRALSRLESMGAPPVERARARLAYFDAAGQNVDGCDELLSKVLSEAAGHPDLLSAARLRMAVRATIAECSPQRATVHARRAVQYAVVAGDKAAEVMALTYLARSQRAAADPAAEDTLSQALAVPVPPGLIRVHTSPQFISAKHSFFDDRLEESRAELLSLLPSAEAAGGFDDQYEVLRFLAEVEARMGRCTSARAYARRALTIAEHADMSPGPTWYSASVAELAAGDLANARALAERAIRASNEERDQIYLARALHVKGIVQLVTGDAAAAVETLRTVRELEINVRDPSLLRWHGDLAEALVAIGETVEALTVISETRGVAEDLCHLGVLATLDRAEGIYLSAIGSSAEASSLLQRSADDFAKLGMPLEQGRTLLALGAAERRRRRWAAARQATEVADALYRDNGASPWAVAQRGSGNPATERFGLTLMENKLIELVASGATNREIAHTMFLSIKTVESSLTRIYRKVGVRSRMQLSTLLNSLHGESKG